MSAREDIQKRITKEKQKIADYQKQIERSNAFIQGMQEALDLLSGNPKAVKKVKESSYFRAGDTKNAYDVLRRNNIPMHIDDILLAIGKPINRKNRASLASSLHRAAKKSGIVRSMGNNNFSACDEATSLDTQNDNEVSIDFPDNFGEDIKIDNKKDIPF
jgi:hypothetical protein